MDINMNAGQNYGSLKIRGCQTDFGVNVRDTTEDHNVMDLRYNDNTQSSLRILFGTSTLRKVLRVIVVGSTVLVVSVSMLLLASSHRQQHADPSWFDIIQAPSNIISSPTVTITSSNTTPSVPVTASVHNNSNIFPEFPTWPELKWKRVEWKNDNNNNNNATNNNDTNHSVYYVGYLRLCRRESNKGQQIYAYRSVESANISIDDPCDDDDDAYDNNEVQPSPLIRMTPGNTYKLVLINHIDEPTNLHTHGLHVSGVGTVDDITRNADPETCLVYEYRILDDADVGTFWYHSHRHPLATNQVSNGAYGMLLVEETETRMENYYPPSLRHFLQPSRQVILQYASLRDKSTTPWGRKNWMNGKTTRLDLLWTRDEWYYVRISAVVISDPVNFVQIDPPTACEARVVAYDGVYRSKIPHEIPSHIHMLSSSSRVDLAVRCHESASFHFHQGDNNGNADNNNGKNKLTEQSRMVQVHVAKNHNRHRRRLSHSSSASSSSSSTVISSPYWNAKTQTQWEPRRPYYMPNLLEYPDVVVQDIWNVTMSKNIDSSTGKKHWVINQHHWEPSVPIRPLPLNQTVEWTLYNTNSHPFHIHINRMQIVEKGGCGYRYEEGEYYDTIAAAAAEQQGSSSSSSNKNSCRVRLQFWDFAGRVIVHCHKLKHEDKGMMVWINVTNGPGAGMEGRLQEACAAVSLD